MVFKMMASIAALGVLAGCVTVDPTPLGAVAPIDTWQGFDLREMIPPLELVAAASRARSSGRVARSPRAGGAYQVVPPDQLALVCAAAIHTDEGPLVGCTVRTLTTMGWTYAVYVSDQYPEWYRELIGTREFGHIGQSEFNIAIDDAGFTSPTASLVQRLGG